MENEGFFKVKKITNIKDLDENSTIPESDLTVQEHGKIYQFSYEEPKDDKKIEIKPGSFSLEERSGSVIMSKTEIREHKLLKSVLNTSIILKEAEKFEKKIDSYYRAKGRDPKRAILMCSPPGVGKSAAISDVARMYLKRPGTCVCIWDTSAIRSSDVSKFFLQKSEFTDEVKMFIFIIEDIEGGSIEDDYGPKTTHSSLLNLLDGVGVPFKGVPTFIMATTNNPEKSVGPLIDRPGRFDKVIELSTPKEAECVELLKFMLDKKKLSNDELKAAAKAAKCQFSIAHLQEVVDRMFLDDIDILESTDQLAKHKERFQNGFLDKKTLGI